MQIYYTDKDPARCAANLPDSLTNKILVEVAQILCTVCHKYGIDAPYKATHENHPFVKWASESWFHWAWLYQYANELHMNYRESHKTDRIHKSWAIAHELPTPIRLLMKPFATPPRVFIKEGFPKGILQKTKGQPIEIAYQKYLNWKVNNWKREGKNKRLYTWTNRPQPEFITLED